jgi:tetratricopeptide (TPR) repeat protein
VTASPSGPGPPELVEERDFLLRSLDDLERERAAGDVSDVDYATLHRTYTARAAAVLRALEREGPPPGPAPRPRQRTLAVATGVAALAVAAGLAVASASGSRLPGDTATGDVRATGASRLADAARLAKDDPQRALELYDEVLADEPDNVRALSERGLLLASLGASFGRPALVTEGRRSVEAAVELAPGDPEVLFSRALTLRLAGEDAAAEEAFAAALAADPPPALRRQVEAFLEGAPPD